MLRRASSVAILTGASQLFLAVGLLLLQSFEPSVADRYSLAIQAGSASFSGVVYGIVYNLAIGRPTFGAWRFWKLIGILASLTFAVFTIGLSSLSSDPSRTFTAADVALILMYGVGGAGLSLAGIEGVRRACTGHSIPLAGTMLLPNLIFFAAIAAVSLLEEISTLLMLVPGCLWMIAGILLPFLPPYLPPKDDNTSRQPESSHGEHATALSIGVFTSTLIPILSLNALSALPTGILSKVFLVNRIGGAAVSLGVNSFLLVNYRWGTTGKVRGTFAATSHAASATLLLGSLLFRGETIVTLSLVSIAWLMTIVVTQPLVRELNAQRLDRLISYKVLGDSVLTVAAVYLLFSRPSVEGFFAITMISQGVSSITAGLGLTNKVLLMSSVFLVAVSFVTLVGYQ